MRQVDDRLVLHDVHVVNPCAKEATASDQKWNFVVPAGALNVTDNQIEKIRSEIIGSKDLVRSNDEIFVILTEGFPAILVNELNQ